MRDIDSGQGVFRGVPLADEPVLWHHVGGDQEAPGAGQSHEAEEQPHGLHNLESYARKTGVHLDLIQI